MGEITNVIVHILLFIALYFEVFLLISFFEGRFGRKNVKAPAPFFKLPSVTILVPCYNEERSVVSTVNSILRLEYPRNKLRIFVIDDGSTDSTWNVLRRFKSNSRVKLFKKENGGKHSALNMGLSNVTTELVGCLDADSYVEKSALYEIVRHFADKTIMCVTPAIKLHNPRNILELIQKAEYSLSIFIRRVFASLDCLFITPGPFSIFRKSVFDTLGNYREAYHTEDMEIALRMQAHHYKIANTPDAHVYTRPPRTLKALFRQRLRWTYGFLQNARNYRFLFFKKEYGALGLFILPMAVLSVFPAIFFSTLFLDGSIRFIYAQIERVNAIGFNLSSSSLTFFDPFFINTDSIPFLVYMLVLMTLSLILIGKKWGSERLIGFDIPLYLLLYGFLAPWWLGKGVLDTIRSKKQSWTHEIETRTGT